VLQLAGFARWYRQRPFVGGLLVVLAGVELFFSGQLDIGKIHVQVGIEGLQATILPIILVLVGVLAVFMPAHRIFYGVIALVVAIYSLVGVNLGGFFVGMLLGAVGGVLVVSWMPTKRSSARKRRAARTGALAIGALVATGCLAAGDLHAAPSASAAEPTAAHSGLCLLGFIDCDPKPAPTPTPTGPGSSDPGTPASGGAPATAGAGNTGAAPGTSDGSSSGGTPAQTAPKQKAVTEAGAPVFTQPSGDLSGTSISLGGLHYIGLVKVPISDGRTITALKLGSDHVGIRDFSLTTKEPDGHGVRATAVTMALDGNVVVYANSVSAKLGDGTPVKYDTTAPPTPGELLSELVHVHLGLVGVTADTVSYAPSEQAVY